MTIEEPSSSAVVLMIDDDEDLLNSWSRVANQHGLRLETAKSWDAGLAMFRLLSPDLVICDYNLPGSTHGLQLLQQIRALRPTTRLILISGIAGVSSLERAQEDGYADMVLVKGRPETGDVFEQELDDAIARYEAPTDWVQFADARLAARSIDLDGIAELDSQIASRFEE